MRQLHVVDGVHPSDEALEALMGVSISILESRNGIVQVGAGISTNAGIPVSILFAPPATVTDTSRLCRVGLPLKFERYLLWLCQRVNALEWFLQSFSQGVIHLFEPTRSRNALSTRQVHESASSTNINLSPD
jgi:hypothetical protein